jgi:hypothetical protein
MNLVYPSAVDAWLVGSVDVTTAVLKAELLEGYVPADGDAWLADIDGATRFGSPETATVSSVAGGTVNLDPLTFPSVAAGHTADAVVLYVDSGSDATRLLLVLFVEAGDGTPLALVTDDGDIGLSWPRGAFKL